MLYLENAHFSSAKHEKCELILSVAGKNAIISCAKLEKCHMSSAWRLID